jgi:hypothetical protein
LILRNLDLERLLQEMENKIIELEDDNKMMHEDTLEL